MKKVKVQTVGSESGGRKVILAQHVFQNFPRNDVVEVLVGQNQITINGFIK